MTLETLRSFTRFLTNTDSTTYTDTNLDANLNYHYDQLVAEAIESMDDWDFGADFSTSNLVANQQEYVFPSTLLKIKRVEITYDGVNWYKATPMDISMRSEASDTTSLSNDFVTTEPYFDLMDNSVFLYPIPTSAVTAGIKIWYEKTQTALSGTTDTPAIPAPFHKGLCYGAAEDFFDQLEKYSSSVQMNGKKELVITRMKRFFNKRNQEGDYIALPNFVDYDYGNN